MITLSYNVNRYAGMVSWMETRRNFPSVPRLKGLTREQVELARS